MKKFSLSFTVIYMLALLAAIAVYWFAYFMPAQNDMTVLRAETALFNGEASVYGQYLSDTSSLEADIEAIQKEIDNLHATGYINDSTVSFKISDAIQRYSVSLSSISLSSETTFEGYRVLPLNLSLKGSYENIISFIRHFENNEEGSYLVRGVSLEIAGSVTNASMVIFLCTPNV